MISDKIQKAIICCRVSSARQIKDGHGLESQEQRCRQYAQQKGYVHEKTFYDEGVSGALLERPAIKDILRHIDDHPGNNYVVIFDNVDRIARDIEVHWAIKKSFGVRNVKVESPNFNFEDTPEGKLVENIIASQSQYFREQNARQVKQKMRARLEAGCWCLSEPLGMEYRKTEEYGKLLFPKNPEADLVKEVLENFASDRLLSKVDVLNFLEKNKDRIPGVKIKFDLVNRIFSSAVLYSGQLEYAKWDVSRRKAHHQSLISIEICEKVEAKLKNPEKRILTRDREEFPLRRLIYCAVCGKKMTGSKVKGKHKHYMMYSCNNKGCTASPKNIQTHILEGEYKALLGRIVPENAIIELAGAISLDVWNKSILDIESTQRTAESEIAAREARIEEYLDLIPGSKSEAVKRRYEEKIEQLGNEILKLKKQPGAAALGNYQEAFLEVEDFLRTPDKYWEKSRLEGKFMIHNLIFSEALYFDLQNKFRTPKTSLPFAIKDAFLDSNSACVDSRRFELLASSVQARRSTN